MGDATKTRMGVCNVSFKGADLGYTKGYVKCEYSTETVAKEVDQEDAPIDELITKQNFQVIVPMAEHDLDRMATLLPGATIVTDGTKKKMVLSGAAGAQLQATAGELILTPVGGGDNDKVTVHHAGPVPNFNFSFEKENLRVYEVTFKAYVGENGWVTFGDTTATGA